MPDNSQRPFRGVFDMFSELNRMREHWTEIEPTQGRSQPAPWVPAVDIFASGHDLVIRCELAGVAKEEIDVSLDRRPAVDLAASAPARPRTGPTSTSASAATGRSSAASSSRAGSAATRSTRRWSTACSRSSSRAEPSRASTSRSRSPAPTAGRSGWTSAGRRARHEHRRDDLAQRRLRAVGVDRLQQEAGAQLGHALDVPRRRGQRRREQPRDRMVAEAGDRDVAGDREPELRAGGVDAVGDRVRQAQDGASGGPRRRAARARAGASR